MTPSKIEGQQEGSGTSSRTESKSCTPQGSLGSPPVTTFDAGSLKWGSAEKKGGYYQEGWGNKVRVQAGRPPGSQTQELRRRRAGTRPSWRALSTGKMPLGSNRSLTRRRRVPVWSSARPPSPK